MVSVKLNPAALKPLRQVDERLMSYNVEMTEVTGGTFWKTYTPEQIAGTEKFPPMTNMYDMAGLMQWFDPIDTTNPRLIRLARELGPVWMRVSGGWATRTYYDFEGTGVTPEGYQNRLTKEQWVNLIKFADAIGAKILISVANCEGLHHTDEPWNPSQAELIFNLSKELGHPIDAVEFTNEPNMMEGTGFPKGYKPEHFRRDQDIFNKWIRENHPGTLVVGPCTTDSKALQAQTGKKGGAGVGDFMYSCTTDELLAGCTEQMDAFSYHYYNGISERMESFMPSMHWQPEETLSEDYLAMAGKVACAYAPYRDRYIPGAQMWVTESGDAGGGGNTWASTYMDVFRTLNELGEFATITDGVIFHNTLASSDYGFLQHGTFEPRPNYFAALLWNRLMGKTVYATCEELREGAHVFAHSRKDGKEGIVYLVINNSKTDVTAVELPSDATVYTLTGRDGLRSRVMQLNGRDLVLGENDELPCLCGAEVKAGTIELPAASCSFIIL